MSLGPIDALLALIGLMATFCLCGGALAFGVAVVCRWMEWAPISVTVNVHGKLLED